MEQSQRSWHEPHSAIPLFRCGFQIDPRKGATECFGLLLISHLPAWTPSLVCFDGPEKSGDLIVSLIRCNHGSRQLASRQMFNVAGGLVTCATQPRSPVSVAVFPDTSATPYTKIQPHQVRVKDRFHAYILVWRLDQRITPSTDFAVLTTTRNCRRLGFSHGRKKHVHARSVVEICKATCAPGLHLLVLGPYYTSRLVAGMFRSSYRSCGCAASQSSSFKRNRLWQRAVVICQASRTLQDLQQTEQEYI